jgi:hypothetical protein
MFHECCDVFLRLLDTADDGFRFEDPYKNKVQCWLRQSEFFLRPIGLDRYPVPGSVAEKVDLRECKVRYIDHVHYYHYFPFLK